jgi:glycosyltransferase involved in cell wall biosynthesis
MDQAARHRALLEASLRSPAPFPEDRFAGRGIVLCGGGDVYFPCAWVCIGMLRRLGCTLPIELWYRGRREMTEEMIALVEPLGVACVDAYQVARAHPCRRLDSWELKPFAVAWSRFAEVLYLDADNVPLRDPAFLFDRPEYQAAGALFWPDRYAGPGTGIQWLKREAWDACGVPYRAEAEIEAGQLLIDKRRSWRALQMTLHLNGHSDYYYAFFLGDKDTFHLAWRRTGTEYALVPWPPRTLGQSEVIVQHDPDGAPLFQHRNGSKWSLTRANRPIPGFREEDACLRILAELSGRWAPPVRAFPADFTESERRHYDALCAARYFEYAVEGGGTRRIELRPDFRVGEGAGQMEAGWMIEDDAGGGPLLSLRNVNAPTCFLRPEGGGAWGGRWLVYHRGRVTLRPVEVRATRGVHVVGPFAGPTGHDRHTREFVRHLVRRGVPVQLTSLDGWSVPLPEGARETGFDALRAPVDAGVTLHFTMPTLCRPRAGAANVNYTMFEADRIPREWAARAAEHERIVVPTESSRRAWLAGGVAEEKLRIVPLAVDGDFFGAVADPLELALPTGRTLSSYTHRFLNIADLRPRKNHLGLLRAWTAATRSSDDAVLVLKLTAPHPQSLALFQQDVAEVQARTGRTLAQAAPVAFLTGVLADEQLRGLYRAATHYLSLSCGEGWDFPMMESAAAGLQLVAPAHTAYLEYLTADDAELIPAALVPAVVEGRAGAEDRRWFDGACWWRPDEDAAADVIRRIVDGRAAPKASPAERIRRTHRWDAAAARLHEVLAELA